MNPNLLFKIVKYYTLYLIIQGTENPCWMKGGVQTKKYPKNAASKFVGSWWVVYKFMVCALKTSCCRRLSYQKTRDIPSELG